jgi:hypothetical protein
MLLMLVNRRKVDLRYAVAAFIGATLLFNFFFLSSAQEYAHCEAP